MKSPLKILVFVVCSMSTNIASAQKADTSFAGAYFLKQVEYFEALPVKKHPVVFLGNSITEVGEWSELFDERNVINRGISGDVTYGVINRLPFILAQKPKKLFLAIGVNDIKRGASIEEVSRNYEKIIKMTREMSPRTKLYVQSILPVNEGMLAAIYSKITNDRILKVNQNLRLLSSKYKCVYVDLHRPELKGSDGQLKATLSTDGLHLQPLAYIIWGNYLKSLKYIK